MADKVIVNRMEEGFALTKPDNGAGMMQTTIAREAQEAQAQVIVAKRFPRDETAAYNKIMKACKRPSLAESSLYEYPRGGQKVTGPSIRLAEALAQNWGNLNFGIKELEQRDGESTIQAYAWDLETNTRQEKIFTVKHQRRVGKGKDYRIDELDDPRDIYEMTANQGARRLRACILGVIPGDVVDAAVAECEKTLAGKNSEPLIDRIRKMVGAFSELGVSQEMIEARLQHKIDATTEREVVGLKKIYASLRDGMAGRDDFFGSSAKPQAASELDRRLKDGAKTKQSAPTEQPPAAPPLAAYMPQPEPEEPPDEAAAETPSDNAPDLSTYEKMSESIKVALRPKGVTDEQVDTALKHCVVALGKEAKSVLANEKFVMTKAGEQSTQEWREQCYRVALEGVGYFRFT